MIKRVISLVLFLAISVSLVSVSAQSFNDISGHWAENDILSALEQGIVNGDGTGNFRPNDMVTRAEFVKMVSATVAEKAGIENISEEYKTEDNWYSKYVNFAYSTFLIRDIENTIDGVNPGVISSENATEEISRWEMAYISASMINVLLNATDDTNIPQFDDIAEIEALPGKVPFAIKLSVSNGILKGTGGNKFSSMNEGTRAEAVVIVLRLAKAIDDYLLTAGTTTGSGGSEGKPEQNPNLITYSDSEIPKNNVKVKFTMENGKSFIVETYPEFAPQTVANFTKLVNDGFYDGLTFHRVVEGFMAQGGDPEGTGMGGSDKNIKGEFSSNGFTQNTLSHERGVISMARSSAPDSASSQFFICYEDASFLDGNYAAFGKVIEGMEVVDGFLDIERMPNSMGEMASPVEPIVIKSATVIK